MQTGQDGAFLCPLLTLLAPPDPGLWVGEAALASTAGVCEQEILREVLLTPLCFQPCPPKSQIQSFQALLLRDLWGGCFPAAPLKTLKA